MKNWKVTRLNDKSAKVENIDTWFCDYPIKYDNGEIGYDYPEKIPAYVKKMVKEVFKEI